MRIAEIERKTKETAIKIALNLEGGEIRASTGVGFFDHMLTAFAFHGGFGLEVKCEGDLWVDCHHTVEDVGIVLGKAFLAAAGDRAGIVRFGSSLVPMDEALARAVCDISGRAFLVVEAVFPQEKIGEYDACMTVEFFRAFVTNAGITLHLCAEYGSNSHHMIEAIFKAAGRALREALEVKDGNIASTKGVL